MAQVALALPEGMWQVMLLNISKIILFAEYNLQLSRCNFVFESFCICVSSSSSALLVTLFLVFQCCEMFSQVNWDESTAGERQKRVSLWEIEPLTTPYLLCPSPFTMRSKRPRGIPGEWRLSRLWGSNLWMFLMETFTVCSSMFALSLYCLEFLQVCKLQVASFCTELYSVLLAPNESTLVFSCLMLIVAPCSNWVAT